MSNDHAEHDVVGKPIVEYSATSYRLRIQWSKEKAFAFFSVIFGCGQIVWLVLVVAFDEIEMRGALFKQLNNMSIMVVGIVLYWPASLGVLFSVCSFVTQKDRGRTNPLALIGFIVSLAMLMLLLGLQNMKH